MLDRNNKPINEGSHIKYSFNECGIPMFYGRAVIINGAWYIEHSNKVTVELDERIKYIELISGYTYK